MNFKALIISLVPFFLLSCGVKSKPIAPKDTILPSYPDQFTQDSEEIKKKKKAQ